jgi:hypothetical protein
MIWVEDMKKNSAKREKRRIDESRRIGNKSVQSDSLEN